MPGQVQKLFGLHSLNQRIDREPVAKINSSPPHSLDQRWLRSRGHRVDVIAAPDELG